MLLWGNGPMATVGAVGVLVVLQMVFVDGKNVATAWQKAPAPLCDVDFVGGDLTTFLRFLDAWGPAVAVPATFPHHATIEDFHHATDDAYATYHTDHQANLFFSELLPLLVYNKILMQTSLSVIIAFFGATLARCATLKPEEVYLRQSDFRR